MFDINQILYSSSEHYYSYNYIIFINNKIIITDLVNVSVIEDTQENRKTIEKEEENLNIHKLFIHSGNYEEYDYHTGMDEYTTVYFSIENNAIIMSYDVDCNAFGLKEFSKPKRNILSISFNGDITILDKDIEEKTLEEFYE